MKHINSLSGMCYAFRNLLNVRFLFLLFCSFFLVQNSYSDTEQIVLSNGVYSSDDNSITWSGTSCVITQTKGSSTNAVNSNYISAPRWYKSHAISFSSRYGLSIDKVVIVCTNTDYATALAGSIFTNGVKAKASSKTVTLTCKGDFSIKMGALAYISSIEVTYSACPPLIQTNSSGLDFSYIEVGSSKKMALYVSGDYLLSDMNLAISGDFSNEFALDTEVLHPSGVIVENTPITITCTPQSEGKHTAVLTISTDGAADKLVNLSAECVDPVKNHKVSWMVNGTDYNLGEPTTVVYDHTAVTQLPTPPAAIGQKAFLGWTDEPINGVQLDAPKVLFNAASDAPLIDTDATYYAVFASQTFNTVWTKIAEKDVNEEGIYVIINEKGYAFDGTIVNGRGGVSSEAFAFSDGEALACPEGVCELTLTKVDGTADGFAIYNAEKGYLYARSSYVENLAWGTEETDFWHYSNAGWLYAKNGAYLRFYNDKFNTLGNKNGASIYFAKKNIKTDNYDFCTTVILKPSYTGRTLSLKAKNNAGYWSTFSCNEDVFIPSDVTVYAVVVDRGNIHMDSNAFEKSSSVEVGDIVISGTYVPSNTGVLINSQSNVFGYYTVANKSLDKIEYSQNMLLPAPVNGGTFVNADGCIYYKLAYGNFNEQTALGFYWGADNGGVFYVKSGSAYLAVPSDITENSKSFTLDNIPTGVSRSNMNDDKNDNVTIHSVMGQKINTIMQPGIYIVNGKKVAITK